MATSDDRVPGPDHRLEINVDNNVAMDEVTGTPPFIPAQVRTVVYIVCLAVNILALVVFGILPVFDILDAGKAAQVVNIIITAINMLSLGLAVGYRPTRPGSPINPEA